MVFSNFHDKCMEFVEMLEKGRVWIAFECGKGKLLQVVIADAGGGEGVADGDASKVFVNHHDRMAESIKQDHIRGLRTDPGQCEQLLANLFCRQCSQLVE